MADKRCPNYYAKKKLFKKEEESYCESASRYNSLGNFGGLGEPADHNPCLCSNYEKCNWFLEDSKLKKLITTE